MSLRIETRRNTAEVLPIHNGPKAKIIPIIARAPQSWIRDSLSQITARIPDINQRPGRLPDYHGLAFEAEKISEARWKEKSGFEAADSGMTLVFPIHNEEASLRDFLGVIKSINLPGMIQARLIFGVNASSDRSKAIVEEFLREIGIPTLEPLPHIDRDPQLKPNALVSRRGNLRYTLIETDKAGKANVLSVANDIAVNDGSKIVINSDTNTYPEPDAIAALYGAARHAIEENNGKTVVVWGNHRSSSRDNLLKRVRSLFVSRREEMVSKPVDKTKSNGWLFAWDSEWLHKQEAGIPQVCIEDRALSVAVRVAGLDMENAGGAVSHGFHANNIKDLFSTGARSFRGTLQIAGLGEDYKDVIYKDKGHFDPSFRVRFYRLRNRIGKNNSAALWETVNFLINEAAIVKGRRDFYKDPNNQSWEKIESTK